ncbi:MAG: TniB family NTP-binding protein [Gammaproteobacteria bacterium]|nr:TniB family NTP-binding protein [Gammaproteobacteria bacterium]MCP5136353.1 TniB family NTP-binding protein [Gammaproteobacteria bacterium]
MTSYTHLNRKTREAVIMPREQRLAYARRSRWVPYERAIEIESIIDDLLQMPVDERVSNLLIFGSADSGKTELSKHYFRKHLPKDRSDGEGIEAPVIWVEAPSIPDEKEFYEEILTALRCPFKLTDGRLMKRAQVNTMIEQLGIRLIIVDEFHNVLAGGGKTQAAFLAALKRMSNVMGIKFAMFGTQKALRVIESDEQLSSRFEIEPLPKWRRDAHFQRLLVNFERQLPLKEPSKLHQPELAEWLFDQSEGMIGELSRTLRKATVHAISHGREQIDIDTLKSLKRLSPSARRKHARDGY